MILAKRAMKALNSCAKELKERHLLRTVVKGYNSDVNMSLSIAIVVILAETVVARIFHSAS